MTRNLFATLAALAAIALPALLAAQPVVTNVTFVQEPDGLGSTRVQVGYDVASPNGDVTVFLLYSTDSGTTFSTAQTVSGDVGAGITPGTGKSINWAAAIDAPGVFADGTFQVRIVAEDDQSIPLAIDSTVDEDIIHQVEVQTFTFTFDEDVTGFDASDVVITGGTGGAFTAVSGSVYELEVTGTGGPLVVYVPAGVATSALGSNTNAFAGPYENYYQDTLTVTLSPSVDMELIRIPAGTFLMGSPPDELSRSQVPGRETQHQVTLTQDYYMTKTPVTQAQWLAVNSTFPGGGQSWSDPANATPVHNVNTFHVAGWIGDLETLAGRAFSLPTEAQWEYAARAGTTTRFNFGDGLHPANDEGCGTTTERVDNMWYCGNNSSFGIKPAGQKPPNAWGLYDMHGNLWEWCQGFFGPYEEGPQVDPTGPASGDFIIIRGGGFNSDAGNCRSAFRGGSSVGDTGVIGFRVVTPAN